MKATAGRSILVIGAGTMGAGIAQVAAASGEKVALFDRNPSAAEQALSRIDCSLERAEARGHIAASERLSALANLSVKESLREPIDSTIVIEAIKEDLSAKQELFVALEESASPETMLWTNTSMLSISELARPLLHQGRFCGVHFFNPVPRMRLVEVIAGRNTGEQTLLVAEEIVRKWGKTPVRAPDSPGFIVNRIFDAIKREALDLLKDDVTPDQVDVAVRLGLNFPMGPFELMDLIGLDTTLDVLRNQAKAMGRPSDFANKLTELVEAGNLGRKTRCGFYSYPVEEKPAVQPGQKPS